MAPLPDDPREDALFAVINAILALLNIAHKHDPVTIGPHIDSLNKIKSAAVPSETSGAD